MSTVFVGRQGAGKTFALAVELLEQIKRHPEQSFFIFDWSGGLISTLYRLVLSDPQRNEIENRLVYDAMGGRTIAGETYIMPMPEFSRDYDPEKKWIDRVEDQSDRVQSIFEDLNPNLIALNPTMGGRPVKGLLPNLLQLANAVIDEQGNSCQLTEATKLLNNDVRKSTLINFGARVGKARDYFNYEFKGEEKLEKDMAQALADVLDVTKSKRIRARVGYPKAGWSPKEAIQKGLIVACDGTDLNNNHMQKDYAYYNCSIWS
jgi:hypothetical protein